MTEPQPHPESPNEPKNEPLKPDIWDIFIVCWIVISLIIASDRVFEPWARKFKYILSELLQIFAVGGYLFLRRYALSDLFRWRRMPGSIWKYLIPLALGLAIGFDALDRVINIIIPIPPDQIQYLREALQADSWMQVAAVVVGIGLLAPWVEESIFRGVIQQAFEARRSPVNAVLGTAILFALVHFQPWWLIQLLIFAVIIGYFTWMLDTIIPAFIIHAANNLFSLALLSDWTVKWQRLYIWEGFIHPLWLLGSAVIIVWSWRKCVQVGLKSI
ncbi:MAG: type II CAAX endopeptidase family protein [Calditrichota bacterium]